jgi:hypothetical protein
MEEELAGTVPVPVAEMIAGSARCSNHSIVSPSDLCPSSRVSWKILAAQEAGIRILRPRPSTLVCLSLVEDLLGGGFFTATGGFGSPAPPDALAAIAAAAASCCCCCC